MIDVSFRFVAEASSVWEVAIDDAKPARLAIQANVVAAYYGPYRGPDDTLMHGVRWPLRPILHGDVPPAALCGKRVRRYASPFRLGEVGRTCPHCESLARDLEGTL